MDKSTWCTIIAAAGSMVAIAFTCAAAYVNKLEQKQKSEETPQWAKDAANQLKRMEGALGNDQMTQEYLSAQRALTQRYTGAMSDAAVDSFIGSKKDREKLRDSVREANAKQLNKINVRMQPIADIFLGMIDGWIEALKKRGVKIESKMIQHDVVVTEKALATTASLREIIFPNGASIQVVLLPGVVQDGRFNGNLQISIVYYLHSGSDNNQCDVVMTDMLYRLDNDKPARYTFSPYEKHTTENPADDTVFIEGIKTAVNQVMAYIVENNAGL